MTVRIVVVGAGRTSTSLIGRLARVAELSLVDRSAPALETAKAALAERGQPLPPNLRTRVGDATSRLVLEDVRGEAKDAVALVVATGEDRATIEVCRLAAELGFRPVVAVVSDASARARCEQLGARTLVKSQVLGQMVEEALHQGGVGVTMATSIGLGKGEILEFRVLPSSPVIGVELSCLHADRWRVAAIYRAEQLVLPTGKTTLEAEDRVVIIGDPRVLPQVAEWLRLGEASFPLLHGPNIVLYLPRGRDRAVEEEAELLTRTTRAEGLVRLFPQAEPVRSTIDLGGGDAPQHKSFEDDTLPHGGLADHIAAIRARRPGVVVARAAGRNVADALLGRAGRDARLCNEIEVPVLFTAGAPGYTRVLLGVSREIADIGVAEVALDVARMFRLPLVVLRVRPPSHLGTASPEVEALVAATEKRARLHGEVAEVRVVEGNPVTKLLEAITPEDLVVLARPRRQRDSFADPDIALRVARSARGSVLVCTVGSP